jgi:biopolymer transport protein ExbD
MNFRRGLRREEPEINLIPMIDLLLVILIFLVVSTTYARFTELGVSLPSASAQSRPDRSKEIVVAISRDGHYEVEGRPLAAGNARALAARLLEAAGPEAQPAIVIQADAGASHQAVVHVLEGARLAGFDRVAFAAQSGSGAAR